VAVCVVSSDRSDTSIISTLSTRLMTRVYMMNRGTAGSSSPVLPIPVAISSSLPLLLLLLLQPPPLLLLLLLDAAELENMVGGTYGLELVSCNHGGVVGAAVPLLLVLFIIGDCAFDSYEVMR
jgi:hypothetical protein